MDGRGCAEAGEATAHHSFPESDDDAEHICAVARAYPNQNASLGRSEPVPCDLGMFSISANREFCCIYFLSFIFFFCNAA